MFENINYYFRKTPLVGGLFDCTVKDHIYAFSELLLTLFFSFSPIIAAVVVDHYSKVDVSIYKSFFSNISTGELFLYSTSILAPIFYSVLDERGEKRKFPNKRSALFIYGGLMFVSAIVFALKRANVALDNVDVLRDSTYFFLASICLLYLVIVYNNSRTRKNPAERMQDEENDFTKRYSNHRGEK